MTNKLKAVLLLLILIFSNNLVFAEEAGSWAEFMRATRGNVEVVYTDPDMVIGAGNNLMPSGTPVKVKLSEKINGQDLVEGSDIDFIVVDDVKVDGVVIIESGTLGSAQVIKARKNGFIGQPGELVIGEFSVKSVFGDKIYLKGIVANEGQSKQMTSLIVGLFVCFPFLLMKGDKAELPAGLEKTVFTGSDYRWSNSTGA